jgi:hypothetical protein
MNTPPLANTAQSSSIPADARVTSSPARDGDAPAEDLDLEEDIAPNLGGEDQMQDA